MGALSSRQLSALPAQNGGAVPGIFKHSPANTGCTPFSGCDQNLYGNRDKGLPGTRGYGGYEDIGDP